MQSPCLTIDEEVHTDSISHTIKVEVPDAPHASHEFLSCPPAPSLLALQGRNVSHQDLQKICPSPVASAKEVGGFRKEPMRVSA